MVEGAPTMKLVELFCGTGGFSRGAHAAGFEVAAAYDLDEVLTSSYPINFPDTKLRHKDVAALTGTEIKKDVGGDVFGLFGGPPCQGFSDIGRRDVSDPRRELLGHFFRIALELKPAFFVMENVRGLSRPDALPLLTTAIGSVAEEYDVSAPKIWNAADFGAATNRHRMFVVGIRKDLKTPFDPNDMDHRRRPAATVRQALLDLEDAKALPVDNGKPGFDRWVIQRRGPPTDYARPLRAKDRNFTGHMPTEHTAQVVERFSKVRPGSSDAVGRHPRLKLGGQCPTLRAGTGSDRGSYQSVRPIHPTLNRVITVREAARLQGFPDEHIFHPTIWHSFRMIGNSVCPLMAEVIFSSIRDQLGLNLHGNDSMQPAVAPALGEQLAIAAE